MADKKVIFLLFLALPMICHGEYERYLKWTSRNMTFKEYGISPLHKFKPSSVLTSQQPWNIYAAILVLVCLGLHWTSKEPSFSLRGKAKQREINANAVRTYSKWKLHRPKCLLCLHQGRNSTWILLWLTLLCVNILAKLAYFLCLDIWFGQESNYRLKYFLPDWSNI